MFFGKCAELCGPSHALMDFKVKTMPRPEFDGWVAAMQATRKRVKQILPPQVKAKRLFAQSCIACHAVSACW